MKCPDLNGNSPSRATGEMLTFGTCTPPAPVIRPKTTAATSLDILLCLSAMPARFGAPDIRPAPARGKSCDDFKAALIDGATLYQIPTPTFQLAHVNKSDSDVTHWSIVTFNEIRAMMVCWHGSVSTFAVDANGLHAYGLEWGPALKLRDDLVRAAKASDPHTANIRIQGGSNASFIISVAGVSSFQIATQR